MDYKTVGTETRNSVRWTSLDRPDKLNSFNERMEVDLLEALKEEERSAGTTCLILMGKGEAFCAGKDLGAGEEVLGNGRPAHLGEALTREYNSIVQRIRRMDKPVVATVNGVTAGIGLGLAMVCDLRAASERVTFREAFFEPEPAPYSEAGF